MKFILIMTLAFGSSSKAVSIHSVEFNNLDACMAAGSAWLKQVAAGIDANYKYPTYLCAAKGAEK